MDRGPKRETGYSKLDAFFKKLPSNFEFQVSIFQFQVLNIKTGTACGTAPVSRTEKLPTSIL
jgi:hypothetical protein